MTTRVAQAIETLQGLILALRTGQLEDRESFTLILDHFDEKWKWLGSYASWRAAMFVFLYPENILQPSLRKPEWQTPAFKTLLKNTGANRKLTASYACEEAKRYAEYFQDICTLRVEASCTSRTRLTRGDGCNKTEIGDRSLSYMFGRGGLTGKVYWSVLDFQDSSGYAQSFWSPVQAPDETEIKGLENVEEIIGAVPYHTNLNERFIFLFARKRDALTRQIICAKYDLENPGWQSELIPPLDVSAQTMDGYTAIVKQQDSENSPPHVIIGRAQFRTFEIKLNADGKGWESSTPYPLTIYDIVLGVVGIDHDSFYMIVHSRRGELFCKLYVPANIPRHGHLEIPNARYKSVAAHLFDVSPYLGAFSFFWDVEVVIYVVTGLVISQGIVRFPLTFWQVRDNGSSALEVLTAHAPITTSGFFHITPTSGLIDSSATWRKRLVYQEGGNPAFQVRFLRYPPDLYNREHRPVMPSVDGPFNIPIQLPHQDLQSRMELIKRAFKETYLLSNLTYLEEAYYFVPIHLALGLQRSGEYLAALDLLRTVYDYTAGVGKRKIYYGLVDEQSLPDTYKRGKEWLLDPLTPHAIAATRQNTYTRYTLLTIIRCLLDYADAEFSRDTPESNAHARRLYLTTLDLFEEAELKQSRNKCDEIIGVLDDIPVPDDRWQVYLREIQDRLKTISDLHKLQSVVDEVREILTTDAPPEQRFVDAREILNQAIAALPPAPKLTSLIQENENAFRDVHRFFLADTSLATALESISNVAAEDFQRTVTMVTGISPEQLEQRSVNLAWLGEPIPRALNPQEEQLGINRVIARRDVAQSDALAPTYMANFAQFAALQPMNALDLAVQVQEIHMPQLIVGFCIPPNPLLKTLRLRAELNLNKLRSCRNIAGLQRQVDPYSAPTDTFTGLPTIGSGGQLLLPNVVRLQPTLYRYPVLIERIKQLVQLAGQIEAAMLSALMQRDVLAYDLLKTRQELSLAQASVRLQSLRLTEANNAVTLARLQKRRAESQLTTYQAWITAELNTYEKEMITAYGNAAAAQKGAADASHDIQIKQSAIASAQLAAQIANAGGPAAAAIGAGVGGTNMIVDAVLFDQLRDETRNAINAQAAAQIASVNASFERRKEEWELQKLLAIEDKAIGEQQITLANNHVEIVTQEKVIEELKTSNAKDTIEFLTTKFLNVNLYDWMSGILEEVYRFFLQQATGMAKLAENQLAFERQEVPPAYIQADYWNSPSDGAAVSNSNTQAPDRKGLTGSARLLQDIYQLDQYAFGTNKRKLQLTKTISLARHVPFEFQRFRETGVIRFATPMEMFDRGFPGHYLRLIKRVRASVIALVPPMEGIHATLSTTGPSRVVIGGDVFQTVPIRRAPEFIALSAPNNSTGVFELDPQPDMLAPFEGSGVDMSWEFNMPKAANRFDYDTIADVLITLEYTALYSADYRQQVIQSLKPTVSADRPFSLRNQFVDQWYDLHNPEQTSTPMTVRFTTVREDFPPNIEALKIKHVLLYFARANATSIEVPVSHLRYTAQDEAGTVGGSATSIDGIISTRRGNAGSWTAMIGKSPAGEWELSLPNTEEIKSRFNKEEIVDILLVITYSGRTPNWPA